LHSPLCLLQQFQVELRLESAGQFVARFNGLDEIGLDGLAPDDRGKASADFAAAVRVDPENAEAHTGLGFVLALEKHPAEAQREADMALSHGAILHNVACIYAALSHAADDQSPAHQEAAVALLQRAITLWKRAARDEKPGPSEIDLIKSEKVFQILHERADFQKLIGQESTTIGYRDCEDRRRASPAPRYAGAKNRAYRKRTIPQIVSL
jgi:hypothetical protein